MGIKNGGVKKGPVIIEQVAICKNSQEVTSKKNGMNKDISNTKTIGLDSDINIKSATNMGPLHYLPIQIQVAMFGHWHQRGLSIWKVRRIYYCGPCQRNKSGRKEWISHGGGKVLGSVREPWSNTAVGVRINTITSGHYHKAFYLRGSDKEVKFLGEKLNPYCTAVKSWWIAFVVHVSETQVDSICGDS